MSETKELREFIAGAVDEYLRQEGGGIPNGYLYAVNYVNSDGQTCNEVGCMEDQSPVLSAGLDSYIHAVTEAWVQMALFGCSDPDCEDCDDCD